jgi:hypothetical protein
MDRFQEPERAASWALCVRSKPLVLQIADVIDADDVVACIADWFIASDVRLRRSPSHRVAIRASQFAAFTHWSFATIAPATPEVAPIAPATIELTSVKMPMNRDKKPKMTGISFNV